MALQTKINGRQVLGIAGEFSDDSPKSARQYIVFGKDASSKPTFGKFFSLKEQALSTGSSEKTTVAIQGIGDDSWSMGILVNPKESFTNGFVTTMNAGTYPVKVTEGGSTSTWNGTAGTIATRGHIWVMSSTTTVAGEPVYVNIDGNVGDATLPAVGSTAAVKLMNAKWIRSAALGTKTAVLSEISIDNPYIANEVGPGSL